MNNITEMNVKLLKMNEEFRRMNERVKFLISEEDTLKTDLKNAYERTPWIVSAQNRYDELGKFIEEHGKKLKRHALSCKKCSEFVDSRVEILEEIALDPDVKLISSSLSDVGYEKILLTQVHLPTLNLKIVNFEREIHHSKTKGVMQ